MSYAWVWSPIVVIDVHFYFKLGRHLEIILFPFPLTTADWIGIVSTIRRGAANNWVLLVQRQYIGAANLLAPIYWCCKHLKNPRKFLSCKMPVCIRLLALQALVAPIYWCCEHRSTNILVLPAHVAPISAHTGLFSTWWSVQFLADFFTIINYRTPCFLYGDHPTPSPVTGRDQWEFRGGGILYIYVGIWLHFHPLPCQ